MATLPPMRVWSLRAGVAALGALLGGALLIGLLFQTAATHTIDVGGFDAAYVQGFHDAERAAWLSTPPAYLVGSNGSARWSRASSYLLLPQAGLPATLTVRVRNPHPSPPPVAIWQDGRTLLGTVQPTAAWTTHTFTLVGSFAKASDIAIELRTPPTALPDGRLVGVLLDRATYQVGNAPVLPYPSQMIYGALLALLGWWLLRPRVGLWLLAGGAVGLAFLLLVRLQPFYPHPLPWLLPTLVLLLGGLLALRTGPLLLARRPWLAGLALLPVALAWLAGVWQAAHQHVTLSVPGVENDFRVYATRTGSLDTVLQADGFYNLGYPLLLWLAQPFAAENAFLAGRLVAAGSGLVLVLAGCWLAALLLPEGRNMAALLAGLALLGSPLLVQYALYVGSDMPFAACVVLALALLLAATAHPAARSGGLVLALLAGLAAGAAFVLRHPGLVLLPWGLLHCLLLAPGKPARRALLAAAFGAGALGAAAPQLAVNLHETGQLLYSQQAKNIWLAVYGNTDWQRWGEVPNSISLRALLLHDPARLLGNWLRNIVAFLGTGAEDTSEFGRALHLRLLAFPANWLALAGLLGWLLAALRGPRSLLVRVRLSVLLFAALYVAGVSVGFVLPRFFLPLAPLYAAAAAWAVLALAGLRGQIGAALLLLALLPGGLHTGAQYVLERQPPAEVTMIAATEAALPPGALVITHLPAAVPLGKYSALAHRTRPWESLPGPRPADRLAAARALGATHLLWHAATPPPLADLAAAPRAQAGPYTLSALPPPP